MNLSLSSIGDNTSGSHSGNDVDQQSAFHGLDSFVQGALVVVGQYRHSFLSQDRSGVDAFVDEMDRRTGQFDAVCECVRNGVSSWERREQSRVSIDDSSGESGEKASAENLHETSRHDEVGAMGDDPIGQGRIPFVTISMLAQPDAEVLDTCSVCVTGCVAVAIDADSDDARRIRTLPGSRDERLQQRPRTGCEDNNPSGCLTRGSQRTSPEISGRIARRGRTWGQEAE